jgi:hypothetical protein
MTSVATLRRTQADDGVDPRIGMLMLFEAATLAVASVLHLSGNVHGRGAPFNAQHAGIAEAVIGMARVDVSEREKASGAEVPAAVTPPRA